MVSAVILCFLIQSDPQIVKTMTWNMKNVMVFLALFMCFNTGAEVYKWVDKDGHTHYGEKPEGNDASVVPIESPPGPDENTEIHNKEREKLLKIYEEEREIKEEKKQQSEKEEKELREKCAELENELKDMKQAGVVFYDLDENGERKYISDKELTARIAQLQQQYDEHCN